MSTATHYAALGVDEQASADQVRNAYRKRARETHPDTGGDPEAFHAVQRAYEVLKDANARQEYDQSLRTPNVPDEPFDVPAWGTSVPLNDEDLTPAPSAAPVKGAAPYVPRAEALVEPPVGLSGRASWARPRWSARPVAVRATVIAAAAVSALAAVAAFMFFSYDPALLVPFFVLAPAAGAVFSTRRWPYVTAILLWGAFLAQMVSSNGLRVGPHMLFWLSIVGALVAVGAVLGSELSSRVAGRSAARGDRLADLAAHWDMLRSADGTAGTLYWISKARQTTEGTDCLVVNAQSGQTRQVWLRGWWHEGLWVLVSQGVFVLECAPDEARVAANRAHPDDISPEAHR